MSNTYPHHETDKQRQHAHRRLRESVVGKLRRHGQNLEFGSLEARDVALRFKDGTPAHLQSFKGELIGTKISQLVVCVYKTEDSTGPMTRYTADKYGLFMRTDLNPQESGSPSESALTNPDLDVETTMWDMFLGITLAVASKAADIHEGIDGAPITAEEALSIGFQIRTASVDTLIEG